MSDETTQDNHDKIAVQMRAAHELHKIQSWPVQTGEYVAARKGYDDLIKRKGWDEHSRDDRRLRMKYQATIDALEITAVQHAHSLGLLDEQHVAAALRLGLLNLEVGETF